MSVRTAIPILLLVLMPAGAAGQSTFEVIPQIGYARFGNLWDGPLGTSVRSEGAAIYGAQAAFRLVPAVALTGSVAWGRSDLAAGLPVLGSAAFGTSETLYYDAGIEFRLPLATTTATPFLQLGAGAVRHQLESGFVTVDATSPAFHVGLGVDVPLGRAFALRLQARDYISRFDAREAVLVDVAGATGHTLAFTAGIALRF